jgi:hypothetical protein
MEDRFFIGFSADTFNPPTVYNIDNSPHPNPSLAHQQISDPPPVALIGPMKPTIYMFLCGRFSSDPETDVLDRKPTLRGIASGLS